ncbi:MAG: GNAT family N-acetyltransferase [Cryomorphaceae bacterium]
MTSLICRNAFEVVSDTEWDEFVENHHDSMVFHSRAYINALRQTNAFDVRPRFLFDEEKLVGLLFVVILKSSRKMLTRFTQRSVSFGGPLSEGNNTRYLDSLLTDWTSEGSLYTEIRCYKSMEWARENLKKFGFDYEPHLDILIDLSNTERVWNTLKSKKRQRIRKAEKNGIEVSYEMNPSQSELSSSYALLNELYQRIKLPIPKEDGFIGLCTVLKEQKKLLLVTLKKDSALLGFRLVLLHKDLIYDWYAADKAGYRNLAINEMAVWHVIKWGGEQQYKVFDFGGAGHPEKEYGVRDFKLQFGGEVVNFGRYQKIHKILMMKFVMMIFKLFQRLNLVSKV